MDISIKEVDLESTVDPTQHEGFLLHSFNLESRGFDWIALHLGDTKYRS